MISVQLHKKWITRHQKVDIISRSCYHITCIIMHLKDTDRTEKKDSILKLKGGE